MANRWSVAKGDLPTGGLPDQLELVMGSQITIYEIIKKAVAKVNCAYGLMAQFPPPAPSVAKDMGPSAIVPCHSAESFAKNFPLAFKVRGKTLKFDNDFRPDPDAIVEKLMRDDPTAADYNRMLAWLRTAGPRQMRQLTASITDEHQ
jgi:hypothetical protein